MDDKYFKNIKSLKIHMPIRMMEISQIKNYNNKYSNQFNLLVPSVFELFVCAYNLEYYMIKIYMENAEMCCDFIRK